MKNFKQERNKCVTRGTQSGRWGDGLKRSRQILGVVGPLRPLAPAVWQRTVHRLYDQTDLNFSSTILFLHLPIHSANTHLLNTYYVLWALGINTSVTKIRSPCSPGGDVLPYTVSKFIHKQILCRAVL